MNFAALLLLTTFATSAFGSTEFARDILPLLEANCFDCHADEKKPQGGVNLERFQDEASVIRDRATWKVAYDQLEAHSMPPPKRKEQPDSGQRAQLLTWLDGIFARPDPALGVRDPGKPVLRRLTRLEYNNTVRDLFGLKMDVLMFPERLPVDRKYFQAETGELQSPLQVPVREFGLKYAVLLPEAGLPGDNRAEHGFRNRGEAMNLSPSLLEQYLELGRAIAHSPRLFEQSASFRALVADPAAPPAVSPVVADRETGGLAFDAAPDFAPNFNVPNEATEGDRVTTTYQLRFSVRAAVAEGTGGTFNAEARNAVVKAGEPVRVRFGLTMEKSLVITPREEMWIAGFATASETSGESLFTNNTKGAKTLTLALKVVGGTLGEGVAEAGICVLSRKGEAGPVTITARFTGGGAARLTHTMPAEEGSNTFFGFRAPAGRHIAELALDGSGFSGNYVLFDDLGFLTNVVAVAPAKQKMVKISAREKAGVARVRLAEFLARAFRHPVDGDLLGRYLAIYAEAAKGGDFAAGMREAIGAALASPEFLYIAEARDGPAPVRALGDYELATRLAYFLWSSAPDAELLALAAQGRLHEPAELERQTSRLLRDSRAKELSESFAVQWLRLDQLFTAKPDPKLFKGFYAGPLGKTTLHGALLVEALLLFETVLVENRSILDFLDADYTWLNPQLARHYGLEAALPAAALVKKPGDDSTLVAARSNGAWYRVALHDKRRGGFATMAGPLTVTALPTRTSPVKRGAWLLETVFNRPPVEPKVAFVLKDDKHGGAEPRTVRQRFEQHRSEPACYSCHVRLDPPGFALEAFDAVGAWREKDGAERVDAHAEWNGQAFDGPAGFKAALMRKPHEFTRGFIEHLLSFALGRKVEWYDAPAVAEIERATAADGYKLQRIVTEIVKSYPFRNVRNDPPATASR